MPSVFFLRFCEPGFLWSCLFSFCVSVSLAFCGVVCGVPCIPDRHTFSLVSRARARGVAAHRHIGRTGIRLFISLRPSTSSVPRLEVHVCAGLVMKVRPLLLAPANAEQIHVAAMALRRFISSPSVSSAAASSKKTSHGLLRVLPEVSAALSANRPVVALESTILAHGMPYPQNLELSREVAAILRERDVTPATIAVRDGVCRAWPLPSISGNCCIRGFACSGGCYRICNKALLATTREVAK